MSKLQGRPEAVAKHIAAVSFGFYTSAEVRAISVKQITSPILFDNLRNPAPNGLYDPALGPLDAKDSCATCRLGYFSCPGHFGHIELAVPVYHPLVFPVLYKLLRATCLNCHRFKMDKNRVCQYWQRLHLIAAGRLKEAMMLADVYGSAESSKKGKGDKGQGEMEDQGEEAGALAAASNAKALVVVDDVGGEKGEVRWTSHSLAAARTVIREFLEKVPKAKCENCKASAPALKVEGKNKIFQMPLAPKAERANELLGIQLRSVLDGSGADITMTEPPSGEGGDRVREEGLALAMTTPKPTKSDKGRRQPQYLTSMEVREHLRRLWTTEAALLRLIWAAEAGPVAGPLPTRPVPAHGNEADSLFLQALLVPPNKFRPTNKLGDVLYEHPQNFHLQRILAANLSVAEQWRAAGAGASMGRATQAWLDLQQNVSALLDSTQAKGPRSAGPPGIRQQLEKKEGLFRKNMMGKRVNYACRSVISPDPYIGVSEIGIPPYFATRLTYPEMVTQWNIDQMRAAVENGPNVHPGATHVEDERGRLLNLAGRSDQQRAAIAKTLLSLPGAGAVTSSATAGAMTGRRGAAKAVYRHLRDGDVVLVNRQPTLHKPGLMAHTARVLKGEKTIRMHYANCSTYNADFDGDEMNVHFPQDELGRAEAYNIVNADQQYIVPTSGAPIRGLIQDHIVSAALLTQRDTFLTRSEYCHLVYAGCGPLRTVAVPERGEDGQILCVDKLQNEQVVRLLPPALVRPVPLWTGKQVVSTLLNHLTAGQPPLSVTAGTKVPADYWGRSSGESEVLVASNELVTGVLDKAQFGKYGLVHATQELYGAALAGKLLSALSRLFTAFLQVHGFTCSIDDLLLTPKAEASRSQRIQTAEREVGDRVHASFGGLATKNQGELPSGSRIRGAVSERLRRGGVAEGVKLDMAMTSALNPITSAVIKDSLPGGQRRPFPHNTMSLMTISGAKGSMVNSSQISALLGQQELEGRRVPRMASGKTLPCFAPFDTAPRAGGFIADRFLTGLKPQEYYFHCMAGRDGLVDTTVKTSRSGYLQRCMVKNLECLAVGYDHTVRDSDGGVVQFLYGEDGLDVSRTSHLHKLDFLARNKALVQEQAQVEQLEEAGVERLKSKKAQPSRMEEDDPREQQLTTAMDSNPPSTLGAVSENFRDLLDAFLVSEAAKGYGIRKKTARAQFRRSMESRFMRSLAPPGEPVGVLAAQSIGEPSTQMTLNTFHFAGRGEANVTLGIPRLREILMTAAAKIATPVMTIPFQKGVLRDEAERVAARLTRLTLAQLVAGVEVGERPLVRAGGGNARAYRITVRFHPQAQYPPGLDLSLEELAGAFRDRFVGRLKAAIKVANKKGARTLGVVQLKGGDEQAGQEQDDEGGGGEGRGKGKKQDEDDQPEGGEDEGEDLAREERQRTQNKSYDEPDEEEAAMAETARKEAEEQEMLGWDEEEEDEEQGRDEENQQRVGSAVDDGEEAVEEVGPVSSGKSAAVKGKGKKGAGNKGGDEQAKMTRGEDSCSVEIMVAVESPKLMMLEIVEKVLTGVEVRHVPGISRAFVLEGEDAAGQLRMQTDGINFEGVMMHADVVDVDKVTTNDVHAMLRTYGVEAARATILREVSSVFGAYGIAVDQRHLSLIADFMTFHGAYRPCNRLGIESSPSPFLKMSFETATHFLTDATLQGQTDHLESPSARIVVGRVVEVGTGAFDLLQNVNLLLTGPLE